MLAISDTARGEPADDADAAVRQLYEHHARALRRYVERFCPDQASAEDIVQETFIRAWRHLPQLSSGDLLVRPWLYRVARNLLILEDREAIESR
jgi:RNA polymerase sigma-70 factor, ECF subfamily